MHIGYRKVGNLMQTRNYVPGKNLWAALTARLTRDFPQAVWNRGYGKVGGALGEQFRFSYLWPSVDGLEPCYLWAKAKDDFDYLFLDSYAGAALDYSSGSTEEGSLHDTEFIAPVTRDGKPVYLIGDLWADGGQAGRTDAIDPSDWQESMKDLQLGGERTYGWGRVSLCPQWDVNSGGNVGGETIDGRRWRTEDGKVIVSLRRGEKIASHVQACGEREAADVIGPVEPLVGREWKEHAGRDVTYAGVYFAPGCEAKEDCEFEIDGYGRWKAFKA
jgi:hypothetical protein